MVVCISFVTQQMQPGQPKRTSTPLQLITWFGHYYTCCVSYTQHSCALHFMHLPVSKQPGQVLLAVSKTVLPVLLQMEEDAVLLLTGLLKLSEAPARAQLQRVLLNLCAHPQTRKQVMQILMSMLRAPLSADEVTHPSQVSPCCLYLAHTSGHPVLTFMCCCCCRNHNDSGLCLSLMCSCCKMHA